MDGTWNEVTWKIGFVLGQMFLVFKDFHSIITSKRIGDVLGNTHFNSNFYDNEDVNIIFYFSLEYFLIRSVYLLLS